MGDGVLFAERSNEFMRVALSKSFGTQIQGNRVLKARIRYSLSFERFPYETTKNIRKYESNPTQPPLRLRGGEEGL